MLIAALLATAATVAAFEDCGGRNTSTSPHRLLSGALLVWGRAQGLRGAEGRAWFHLAKALNLCDADRISSAMEAPGALGDMLGEDLDAALRATTHAFRGDARRAALGFAQAAELAASLTDDAARMRAPLLLYLHGRSAFATQEWAIAATAFADAAEARHLLHSDGGNDDTSQPSRTSAGPDLPHVFKWQADAFARLGDGKAYLSSLRGHVLATGQCSHWPEFCLTLPLPAGALGGVSRVDPRMCAEGEEPPIELVEEERRELVATVRAEAKRAMTADKPAAAEAKAAMDRATARRDLVLASRELECSVEFITERLQDDMVAAVAAAGNEAAAPMDGNLMSLPEVQLAYGQVYYPSVRRLLARPLVARTMRRAGTEAQKLLHLGSNIGTETFYLSMAAGANVAVEGFELVCSLVQRADELRERFLPHVGNVTFRCADALTANLRDTALLWLDNQAWDPAFMRVLYAKIVDEMPDGALLIDFAALDAQFDYPRNWNDTSASIGSVGGSGTLDVVGCATLDASWDRGTGTHVAILRRSSPEIAAERADASALMEASLPAAGNGPLPEWQGGDDVAARWLRLLWNWNGHAHLAFGAVYAALAADEAAYVLAALRGHAASFAAAVEQPADGSESRLPRLSFTHVLTGGPDGGETSSESQLFVGLPRGATTPATEAALAVASRRRLAVDSALIASIDAEAAAGSAVRMDAYGRVVGESARPLAALMTAAGAAAGDLSFVAALRLHGIGWGEDGAIRLSLRCDNLQLLPSWLSTPAQAELVRSGLMSEEEARALLGGDASTTGGWLAFGVLTYTYDTRTRPCDGTGTSDQLCAPVGADLQLFAATPATLHHGGHWVPDFASSASVSLPLVTPATASTQRPGAQAPRSEFGVERGGLQSMPPRDDEQPDGGSASDGGATPSTGLGVHPWWCVCRQFFSRLDVGDVAIPLLDQHADVGLLGLVHTTVSPQDAEDGAAGGEGGSPAWRVSFAL